MVDGVGVWLVEMVGFVLVVKMLSSGIERGGWCGGLMVR